LLRYAMLLLMNYIMVMYIPMIAVRIVQTRIVITKTINPLSQIHLHLSRQGISV